APPLTSPVRYSLHDALPIWFRYLRRCTYRCTARSTLELPQELQGVRLARKGLLATSQLLELPQCRRGLRELKELTRSQQAFSSRSEEHTSELQSRENIVCRL